MLMLFEQILNGLLVGSYYTLLALGLSIIFSLGGVVNLAHGAFYAVGAYLTVLFTDILGFGLAFLITPAVVGLIGIAIEALFLRRLYNKDPILTLLFTFGLAMSGEQALRLIFGHFMAYAGAFHGSGGKAKKRRRMADKMVACVERAQRVQSAGLKELKPANSESDDDDNDTGVMVASVGTLGSSS